MDYIHRVYLFISNISTADKAKAKRCENEHFRYKHVPLDITYKWIMPTSTNSLNFLNSLGVNTGVEGMDYRFFNNRFSYRYELLIPNSWLISEIAVEKYVLNAWFFFQNAVVYFSYKAYLYNFQSLIYDINRFIRVIHTAVKVPVYNPMQLNSQ